MKLSNQVQSLVDAKKYNEAIELLGSVNSPKATDWIHRIEAMQRVHLHKQSTQITCFMVIALFGCIAACSFYLWFA